MRLAEAGIERSANDVMNEMRHLHSVLTITGGRSEPHRRLESPTKTQAEVLSMLGYQINRRGVLQPKNL